MVLPLTHLDYDDFSNDAASAFDRGEAQNFMICHTLERSNFAPAPLIQPAEFPQVPFSSDGPILPPPA